MGLTAAIASFHTNDDDKDSDTIVAITVNGPGFVVAQAGGISGHFDDGSNNGPFALTVVGPIAPAQVPHCTTTVHIDPNGHDTWKFNYTLDLVFDDFNPPLHVRKVFNGIALDEGHRDFVGAL